MLDLGLSPLLFCCQMGARCLSASESKSGPSAAEDLEGEARTCPPLPQPAQHSTSSSPPTLSPPSSPPCPPQPESKAPPVHPVHPNSPPPTRQPCPESPSPPPPLRPSRPMPRKLDSRYVEVLGVRRRGYGMEQRRNTSADHLLLLLLSRVLLQVFVGNLSFATKDAELQEIFEAVGPMCVPLPRRSCSFQGPAP